MIGSTRPRMAATDAIEGSLPSQIFLPGNHLALDFLNSRPMPPGARVDWPCDGIGYVHWLEQVGAIGEVEARRIREDKGAHALLDEVAERAKALREWLRDFVGRHAGRAVDEEVAAELHPLNDLLERGTSYWQIELDRNARGISPDNGHPRLRRVRRLTTPDQLLQPIAEAIADLVSFEDFRRICACEDKACGRLFLDRTKLRDGRVVGATLCGSCVGVATVRVGPYGGSK